MPCRCPPGGGQDYETLHKLTPTLRPRRLEALGQEENSSSPFISWLPCVTWELLKDAPHPGCRISYNGPEDSEALIVSMPSSC